MNLAWVLWAIAFALLGAALLVGVSAMQDAAAVGGAFG